MAKKAAAKPKKTSQKKHSKYYIFTRKHTALVVVGVLVVSVLSYLGVRQYQINQEKKQFAQAELVLADLSKAIQQELGEPISSETSKSCGYSSAKFSTGPPRCSISFELDYSVDRLWQNIVIDEVFNNKSDLMSISGAFSDEPTYGETGNDFSIKSSSLKCSSTLRDLKKLEKNYPGISLSVGCYKDTRQEYFPVSE